MPRTLLRLLVTACIGLFTVGLNANDKDAAAKSGPAADATRLEFTKWSGDINVPDPVAIALDNQGRAYVTQTQRRKLQDLDLREHREWTNDDLSLQSVDDKRAFYHRILAPGNNEQNARHIGDLNGDGQHDYRDLMVVSERIYRLEDADGDGTADSITTFAEEFQTEVTGIAAGVLHHDGTVYATIAPDVWRLQDTDDDGKADQRDIMATGFGLHIAYGGHDMHGLTVGPDGKIYWSIGDKAISVTSKEGRRFHYPNQGGVMRCNPDGSDFEVFAHGLRNVQEPTFDQYGNLFGIDNDSDNEGEKERFVYIVKGMDAGWRFNYQLRGKAYNPWMNEGLWETFHEGQPAYIIPPISHSIDGPAGCAFNPGTALSPGYHNYFFLTGAPNGNQIAFQIQADGASFRMVNDHVIGNGIPLVGINFGPDGALYGVDWGGGYPLNQTGAVWKIDDPKFAESEVRSGVRRLLHSGLSDHDVTSLVALLAHADQRIRQNAQFELVKRNAIGDLKRVAESSASQLSRIHAVWGMGQLARRGDALALSKLTTLLGEVSDAEVLTQVIRTIGDLKTFDGRLLIPFIAHDMPRVRFAAASALGDHATADAVPALLEMAGTLQLSDTYLRFALTRALAACAAPAELSARRDDARDLLRLAAVVALRQQASPLVARFLRDSSEAVATEAARAIHDDFSIPAALPDLAASLNEVQHDSEAFVRRAISAGFRLGRADDAARIAAFAASSNIATSLRLEAISALEDWNDPHVLDRVTGRFRGPATTPRELDIALIEPALSGLIRDSDPEISSAALAAAVSLDVEVDDKALESLVLAPDSAAEVRVQALDALEAQSSARLASLIQQSLNSADAPLRIRALQIMAVRDPQDAAKRISDILASSSVTPERQQAVALCSVVGSPATDELLVSLLRDLPAGESADIHLEVIEAAAERSRENQQVATALAEFQRAHEVTTDADPALAFEDCLVGGNSESGRDIFMTHIAAQCIRCHRIGRQGSNVGPQLDGVATRRDAKYLLRSIIAPSADIDDKYRSQVVVLSTGRIVQGLLLNKDDTSITLTDVQGREIQIDLNDIDEAVEQKTSIMPEMTNTLSRREIRDLVAYLKTLHEAVGSKAR